MTTGSWIKTICAVTLLSAVLTGCGRKGDLERPSVTAAPLRPRLKRHRPRQSRNGVLSSMVFSNRHTP
ncbi:LPS translocon maturation chaperone LptM [Hoeflea alexandrii]|uniref:LPS translocon maturation chaperone LptM n=1 Tax=Hoeflea alexandrii TaxID=288436 RepID=UPI003CCD8792